MFFTRAMRTRFLTASAVSFANVAIDAIPGIDPILSWQTGFYGSAVAISMFARNNKNTCLQALILNAVGGLIGIGIAGRVGYIVANTAISIVCFTLAQYLKDNYVDDEDAAARAALHQAPKVAR